MKNDSVVTDRVATVDSRAGNGSSTVGAAIDTSLTLPSLPVLSTQAGAMQRMAARNKAWKKGRQRRSRRIHEPLGTWKEKYGPW